MVHREGEKEREGDLTIFWDIFGCHNYEGGVKIILSWEY